MEVDPPDSHSWVFLPPERSNGCAVLHFYRKDKDRVVTPAFLEALKQQGVTLLPSFSPYDDRFELSVNGHTFLLIEDALEGCCLVASEAEEGWLQDFTQVLRDAEVDD